MSTNYAFSIKKISTPYSRSKIADELTKKLRNLMAVCRKNLQYAQEVQKQAYNIETKPRNYALSKKV